MKRSKKLIMALLALTLLSQIPFAYRRYELGRLKSAIRLLDSQRKIAETNNRFVEYKGVVHVHSFLGGHSTGSFAEIISAAQANELQFVIITEHPEKDFNTAAMTLKGIHGGVLFLNGNELRSADGDRLLTIPGETSPENADQLSTPAILKNARSHGSIALIAYPEEFNGWDANGYAGVEVYNVYTNAR